MLPKEISTFELAAGKMQLAMLGHLMKSEVNAANEAHILQALNQLFSHYYWLIYEDTFEEITRITINQKVIGRNQRIKSIAHLRYPPAEKVKSYGRCNLPNQSVLYCSFMGITNLQELRPRVGDLITETTWTLKNHVPLSYIPIFFNQPPKEYYINKLTGELMHPTTNPRTFLLKASYEKRMESYPPNFKALADLVMQFIADCFSRWINSENPFNYIFSAFIADKLLNHTGHKVDALLYPSVQSRLNQENLAIKPDVFDSLYKLTKVKESFVIKDPSDGMGGYGMWGTNDSEDFDFVNNEIIWTDKSRQPAENIDIMTNAFNVDFTPFVSDIL